MAAWPDLCRAGCSRGRSLPGSFESEHQPSPAILIFRKMLKRERDYDHPDDYSIPIGSRYHPERAALWEPNSPVSGTEQRLNQAAGSAHAELDAAV